MKKIILTAGTICFFLISGIFSQNEKKSDEQIKAFVEVLRADIRGPYKDIRWFCKDGRINPPKEPCGEGGGVQRARYKDEVSALAKSNHIFLGQILSTTDFEEFWDKDHHHSRAKQYQLEQYLRSVAHDWVWQKAQFYRGAIQIEDEEEWGKAFLQSRLASDVNLKSHYFLLRELARDLPHQGDSPANQLVRAQSKVLSDQYPAFMDLRVKIHGQPEAKDIDAVRSFLSTHRTKLNQTQIQDFEKLIANMQTMFGPVNESSFRPDIQKLPANSSIREKLAAELKQISSLPADRKIAMISNLLWEVRKEVSATHKPLARLALLDLSLKMEQVIFTEVANWQPHNLHDLMQKIYLLSEAAAGCGYIEIWEWEEIRGDLIVPESSDLQLTDLNHFFERSRAVLEWSVGMFRSHYEDIIGKYQNFAPQSYSYLDDRIRGSVLLDLGLTISRLGDFTATQSKVRNEVLALPGASSTRGLNPGYALGELVVVESQMEIEVADDKIYVFNRPPADLKPVAGILTVSEGNLVSHVQLLARNLGIPNAVITPQTFNDLKAYHGKMIFYAVGPKGTVIMRNREEMSQEERNLFSVRKRSEQRIKVSVEKLALLERQILDLANLRANDSGKLCGPKAANLGQLKALFPDNVVDGLVIPFGIFREHMDQTIPGGNVTYWNRLMTIFRDTEKMRIEGQTEPAIEKAVIDRLEALREEIRNMPLLPHFVEQLHADFVTVLNHPLGRVPVFLRSDTNMEDLKDFTGAGLNLTLFNVLESEKILQGIKDVWASPYSERSYRWRQKYLLNPENVYPSILIIPSINADCSGVLITKGIQSDDDLDVSIAFNRGVGGAVDGQAAETYLLENEGSDRLIAPSREHSYITIPASGGRKVIYASFETPILGKSEREVLRSIAAEARQLLPTIPGIETAGPFDMELGFKDGQLWLFQVRPFVENKNARASEYLNKLVPEISTKRTISLEADLTRMQ